MMRVGSLFSGIGGLELGLQVAGVGHTVWQVEKDAFCRAVLEKHWPDAYRYEDVCEVGSRNLERVDVICGGFPCQDLSLAGKGAGLSGERSGLWYEYARIIGELRPRFVVIENVAALLRRGFDEVLSRLDALGYDAEWSCIRVSDVGGSHRRDRLFVIAWERGVANPSLGHGAGQDRRIEDRGQSLGAPERKGLLDPTASARASSKPQLTEQQRALYERAYAAAGKRTSVANADGQQREGQRHEPDGVSAQHARYDRSGAWKSGNGAQVASHSSPVGRVGREPDGVLPRLDVARPGEEQKSWEAPRVVSEEQDRAKRLRALGNAVVPHVARVVGVRLLEIKKALDEGKSP